MINLKLAIGINGFRGRFWQRAEPHQHLKPAHCCHFALEKFKHSPTLICASEYTCSCTCYCLCLLLLYIASPICACSVTAAYCICATPIVTAAALVTVAALYCLCCGLPLLLYTATVSLE